MSPRRTAPALVTWSVAAVVGAAAPGAAYALDPPAPTPPTGPRTTATPPPIRFTPTLPPLSTSTFPTPTLPPTPSNTVPPILTLTIRPTTTPPVTTPSPTSTAPSSQGSSSAARPSGGAGGSASTPGAPAPAPAPGDPAPQGPQAPGETGPGQVATSPAQPLRATTDPAGFPKPGVIVVCGPDNDKVDAGDGRVSLWVRGRTFVVYDAPPGRSFPDGSAQHIVDLVDADTPCAGDDRAGRDAALASATKSSGNTGMLVGGGLGLAALVGVVLWALGRRRPD